MDLRCLYQVCFNMKTSLNAGLKATILFSWVNSESAGSPVSHLIVISHRQLTLLQPYHWIVWTVRLLTVVLMIYTCMYTGKETIYSGGSVSNIWSDVCAVRLLLPREESPPEGNDRDSLMLRNYSLPSPHSSPKTPKVNKSRMLTPLDVGLHMYDTLSVYKKCRHINTTVHWGECWYLTRTTITTDLSSRWFDELV